MDTNGTNNTEYNATEFFCPCCGEKADKDAHFCKKCGTKLTSDEPNTQNENTSTTINEDSSQNNVHQETAYSYWQTEPTQNNHSPKINLPEKRQRKLLQFWNKLNLFSKIISIVILVSILIFLIGHFIGNEFASFFFIVQLVLVIFTLLVHKNIIKLNGKGSKIKYFMLPAVILFMILTLTIYMKGCRKQYQTSSNEFTTIEEMTETTVESPIQSEECIGQDCNSIRDLFQDAGFTSIHFEEIEDIKSSDTEKLYAIESVSIGGEENFSKGQTFENTDEVLIFYHTYAECNITIHVEFIPNLFFSKYDVNLLLDDEEQGEIPHGDSADFELALKPGDYTLTFESDEHSYVRENVSLSVDCDMDISYEISCNKENISIKTLYVDKLTELNEGEVKLDVSSSDYKYENYTKVEKALKKLGFTNIKYSVLYDIVLGWTAAGEVESVSIDKNKDFKRGDVFASDSEIIITYHMKEEDDPNKPAKPTTESPDTTTEEQDVSKPVFYSTNNYETAKKGNTGVFAYRDRGSSYDIYWIIDFDEGYVYYFTDGNGESFCERLKIESGTLNDKIIITYHDGGDKWSYRLHFKYVNHPETLIMNDQNGFDWEYSTTALNDALNLKKNKTIKNY